MAQASLPTMALGGSSVYYGAKSPQDLQGLSDFQLGQIVRNSPPSDPMAIAAGQELAGRSAGQTRGSGIFAPDVVTREDNGYLTVKPFAVGDQNSGLGNLAAALGNGAIGGPITAFSRAGQDLLWLGQGLKDFVLTPEKDLAAREAAQQPMPAPAQPVQAPQPPAALPPKPQGPQTLFSVPGPMLPEAPQLVAPELIAPAALGPAPQMGMMVGPDFSGYDARLAGAAPQATDPQVLRDMALADVLGGASEGLASFNGAEPGTWGQGFAKIGAGTFGGVRQGQARDLQINRQDAELMRQYQMDLARADLVKAQTAAETANANAKVQFQNAAGQYEVDSRNAAAARGFTNEKAQLEADLKNKQTAINYEQAMKKFELYSPKVEVKDGTVITQTVMPDGTQKVEALTLPVLQDKLAIFKQMDLVGKTLGTDNATYYTMKYSQLSPTDIRLDILNRVVSSGQGAQIFGEKFIQRAAEIQAEVESQIPNAAMLKADPKGLAQIQSMVNARLVGELFAQDEINNKTTWLSAAAMLGDPGARTLVEMTGAGNGQ